MSLWSRLFGGAGPRNASATGPGIAVWSSGQAVWTPRRYDKLAEAGYQTNAIGFACIKMIAAAASAIPWLLFDGDQEIEQHKLLDLLARPTPTLGGEAWAEAIFAYLLMSGQGYIEGVGPSDLRPPLELWPLRPDRMKAVAGPRSVPIAYEHEVNGIVTRWPVDQATGRSSILHIKEFHPLSDWYGMGRAEPGLFAIDQHNEAAKHNKALLQNGARPSGALIFKPVTIGGQAQSAPPEIIKAAEERLDADHIEITKRGKPLVLGGNIDWQEMGLSPRDMDFNMGKLDSAREICTAFGVPHILIVPGQATYNNLAMARLQLYEDTVLPLAGRLKSALNGWLTPRYGDRLRLEHDLDQIPALEPRREAKRKSVIEVWKSGLIKRDEARGQLQFDEVGGEEGEEYFKAPAPEAAQPADPEEKQVGEPDQTKVEPDTAKAA